MFSRRLVQDVIAAFVAQAVAMLLSIATLVLMPKVLGVGEFDYWQLFVFYAGYVGLFHLGLNDGVYLLNGGRDRSTIDKTSINSQFWIGVSYQIGISSALILLAVMAPVEEKRAIVVGTTAVVLLLNNVALYYGYVFQAMNETKLYSYSVIVDRLSFCLPLVLLLVMRVDSVEPYLVTYCVAKVVPVVYCLVNARDFFSSGFLSRKAAFRDVAESIRVGIKLTLANLASLFVLGVVRLGIDLRWGLVHFGQFSYALAMVNFVLTFVAQFAMVLFPTLRQAAASRRVEAFRWLRKWSAIVAPAVYVLYFPLERVLGWWIPGYSQAIGYLGVVLPICVFEGKMNVIGTTYLKVLRRERLLFLLNVSALVLSAIGVLVGTVLFDRVEIVVYWAVSVIVVRSIYAEMRVASVLSVHRSALWVGELAITIVFLVVRMVLDWTGALAVVLAAYLMLTVLAMVSVRKR